MPEQRDITFTQELLRKGIHLISLSIPILYIFLDRNTALWVLIPLTFIFILFDVWSRFNPYLKMLVHKLFGKLLRPHEVGEKFVLNGASWVLISAVICVALFPKILTVVSFSILIISDLFAALVGKKFGKHKLVKNKSWEGTSAFILTAIIVINIYGFIYAAPMIFFFGGIAAAVISAFFEAFSPLLYVDDNLSIPISAGFVLWAFGLYAQTINTPFLNLIQ